jgi:hypothetical protein
MSNCFLYSNVIRAASPEQYKLSRSWKSISDEFHLQDGDPAFSGIETKSFVSSVSSSRIQSREGSVIGHNSEDRIARRQARSNSPVNDAVIEDILQV